MDLPASAVEALKAYRHLCGPSVFCQPDGQPLTAGMLKHPLLRALRRAGITREHGCIGWHDLRHTYGSNSGKQKAQQLLKIAGLLGMEAAG